MQRQVGWEGHSVETGRGGPGTDLSLPQDTSRHRPRNPATGASLVLWVHSVKSTELGGRRFDSRTHPSWLDEQEFQGFTLSWKRGR